MEIEGSKRRMWKQGCEEQRMCEGKGRGRGGAGKATDDVHLCKIIPSCAMCMRTSVVHVCTYTTTKWRRNHALH